MPARSEAVARLISKKTVQGFQKVVKKAMLISKLLPYSTPSHAMTKKALVVGIRYRDSDTKRIGGELRGSFQDAKDFRDLLQSDRYGYSAVFMTDHESINPSLRPTKDNLMRELRSLMKDVQKGDRRVFYFAGHGRQRPVDMSDLESRDDSEEDGMNEFLVCLDGEEISDNELNRELVDPTKKAKSRLMTIFDTCHSATLLDLLHHRCNRVTKGASPARRAIRRGVELLPGKLISEDSFLMAAFEEWASFWRTKLVTGPRPRVKCHGFCPRIQTHRQLIFCLSACKDSQQAEDNTAPGSTMTKALIEILKDDFPPRLKDMMKRLHKNTDGGPEPQLSTNLPARMNSFLVF